MESLCQRGAPAHDLTIVLLRVVHQMWRACANGVRLLMTCLSVHDQVREYFPSEEVVDGMLNIYERLLLLRFEKVNDKCKNVWHSSVEQYLCWDKRETGRLLGTLYLDLW